MFFARLLLCAATLLAVSQRPAVAADLPDACADLRRDAAEMQRGPYLLPSFPDAEPGPLYKAAFLYDNAVAVIALAGCGDLADARRIGDALVYAQMNDRFWQDGRLRNGYRAGFVGDGPMKLAGWWDAGSNQWLEDRYQAGSDSGNLAWAMLALLTLDRLTPDNPAYRAGAIRLGTWLRQWRDGATMAGNPGGFRGGTFGHEPSPQAVGWKSTEHNTDLAAAYTRLAEITGDPDWRADAAVAAAFVSAMWRPETGCYATGTAEDGIRRNDFVALDAQVWPLLSLSVTASDRAKMMQHCLPGLQQGKGYAYSAALRGIWTEGTAQAALLMACSGETETASRLLETINGLHAPAGGFYATDQARLPTGFMLPTAPDSPRFYFHLAHLGATAWAALAQRGINPFALGQACAG